MIMNDDDCDDDYGDDDDANDDDDNCDDDDGDDRGVHLSRRRRVRFLTTSGASPPTLWIRSAIFNI